MKRLTEEFYKQRQIDINLLILEINIKYNLARVILYLLVLLESVLIGWLLGTIIYN